LRQEIALIAMAFAAVEVGLFLLIANFLHRVLSAAVASAALLLALGIWGFYPYTQAIVLAAFSWAWLNEFSVPGRSAEIRAIGYGLTLLTLAELVTRSSTSYLRTEWPIHGAMAPIGGPFGFWIGAALVGAITLWVAWSLLRRQGADPAHGPGLATLAGAALVGLISVKAPGLGMTVTMLLLGFANSNRVLAGLGILSLLAYWSYYYYSLEITLLQKSGLLIGAGIALIAVRLAARRHWPMPDDKGAGHA
ncbi:MAG TPA: DUF4401 domain-containing protein, partial [Burkholderiales bacterium]